jgi:hypothetical protein
LFPQLLLVVVLTPFVRVAREKSKIGTSPSVTNLVKGGWDRRRKGCGQRRTGQLYQ